MLKDAKHFNYAYNGRDWPAKFAKCGGTQQSPIALDLRVGEQQTAEIQAPGQPQHMRMLAVI
jgi:hypothetical protein